MGKYLFFMAATALAFFVKGVTGFGNTLVLSPLFSFAAPNRLISPVDLLLSLPANAYMAFRERKHISLKTVLPLSLLLLAGIIPGVLLLKTGQDRILKAILGLCVVAIALEMHLRKPEGEGGRKTAPVLLGAIAVVSGVLSGLYGIGALLVAYISRTTGTMGAFRANLCAVFLVENLFRLVLYSIAGIMTVEAILLALAMLPAAALGVFAGIRAGMRLNPITAKRAVILLMAASGAFLFFSQMFQ